MGTLYATKKYKLTIAVLTMNRSEQLKEAVESCLNATLPEKTQIIIVDNASTDNTREIVEELKKICPCELSYYREEENRGAGGGRNILFDLAEGEYIYSLDDDAVINEQCKEYFFSSAIEYLDENPSVAFLTTQIIDEIMGLARTETTQKKTIGGKPIDMLFCGGSHFLRKSCFLQPPYIDIKYGAEEYLPSIKAIDKGYFNVIDNSISVIHKPKINKWVDGTEDKRKVLILGAANKYATKKLLYPCIFYPILWIGYKRRCRIYLTDYAGAMEEADAIVKNVIRNNKVKKIKVSTVIRMYRDFGMTVF